MKSKSIKVICLVVAAAALFAIPATASAKGPRFSFSLNIDALAPMFYRPVPVMVPPPAPTIVERHVYVTPPAPVPYYQEQTIVHYYNPYNPYMPYYLQPHRHFGPHR